MDGDDDADLMPPELLERERQLMRMNQELDAKRRAAAEARVRAAEEAMRQQDAGSAGGTNQGGPESAVANSPPQSPPRASRSPLEHGVRTPLSPSVRAAAAASAQKRRQSAQQQRTGVNVAAGRQSRIPGPSSGQAAPRRRSGKGSRGDGASPVRTPGTSPLQHAPGVDSSAGAGAGVGTGGMDEVGAVSGLGLEAKVRYQRARLKVLKDERDQAVSERMEAERAVGAMRSKISEFEQERVKLQRAAQIAETEAKRDQKRASTSQAKLESANTQISSLRRELDEMKRAARNASSESNSRDVRLQRALAEVDRLQQRLKSTRSSQLQGNEELRKKIEHQSGEIRRLERQKAELLAAFKKQLRLIDILKRQKLHIEAARMLSFTEDEFAKTLDMGV